MDKIKFQHISIKFNQYILLIIFCALVFVLLIFWFNKLVNQELTTLTQKKQQKAALEERINNLNKLDQEYKTISKEVEYINIILPKQDKLIDTIGKLEKKAEDGKLEFAIKFESEPASHKVPAKLSLKGYYTDVMNYYKWLSTDDILINIKAVDLSDATNILDNTTGSLSVEVYFD